MLHSIEGSGPKLSPHDIKAFEAHLGVALPDDYAAFLLRTNGGRPSPDSFPAEGWIGGPSDDVHWFQTLLSRSIGADDLHWTLDVMRGRLPEHLLPIGSTGSGDLICLWLTGQHRGVVALWDHEAEHRPPTTLNVYPVAQSFAAFLELLCEFPD